MDYSTLAVRLFKIEEWQAVVAILEDMELEAIDQIRNNLGGADTIRFVDQVRSKFREVAADKGMENPFARRNYFEY